MTWGGGTCEVVDLVHFQPDWLSDIVSHEFEIRQLQQMRDVRFLAREKVIEADDIVALGDEPFAEVRTEKPGAAGHQDAFNLRQVDCPR
jgi:hypothetical protein